MSKEESAKIQLKFFTFNSHAVDTIDLKHTKNGWEVTCHGNKGSFDSMCSGIKRFVSFAGAEIPSEMEYGFGEAWHELSLGVNKDIVESTLQRSIDCPRNNQAKRR